MVEFTVFGLPRPRGSKRGVVNPHTGRVAIVDSAKGSREWMAIVRCLAASTHGAAPLSEPVAVDLQFTFPRPKGHYRAGRRSAELRPDAPAWHAAKPDIDKATRAILDGITGVVVADDRLVSQLTATKRYGDRPGVKVRVRTLAAIEAEGRGGAA